MGSARHRWLMIAAFAAIYMVWGSTYLAIRYAIETLPSLVMGGFRFFIAGAIMYVWGRRRAPAPTATEWRAGAAIGALLFLGGNGAVVVAERTIASGLAALLIATEPLMIASLEAVHTRRRPAGTRLVGLGLGVAGVALLVDPSTGGSLGGCLLVIGGSLTWALGSMYGNIAPRPKSPLLAAAIPMLAGGALMLVVGSLAGEWRGFDIAAVS